MRDEGDGPATASRGARSAPRPSPDRLASAGTWTLADLAARYHCHPDTLRKKLARLYAAGFPRPVPMMGQVWSARHIETWEATAQEPPLRRHLLKDIDEDPAPWADALKERLAG